MDPASVAVPVGLGGKANDWRGVGPTLARHGEVVALELPLNPAREAHARSSPFTGGLEFLDRALASAPEPAVLIGHSMGAVVSMLIAASQPDRLDGLVLTAPFLPVARNGRSTLATATDYAGHRGLFLAGAGGRRRQRSEGRTGDWRAHAAGLRALAHYGLRPDTFHAAADRVSCPVLLVHGREDHYVPAAFARAAGGRHPAWRLELIEGGGHFPHRDNAAAWLNAVEPWLEDVEPS